MRASAVLCIFLAMLVAVFASTTDYGSYIAVCDSTSTSVTFINYPHANCLGAPSNFTTPIGGCQTEFLIASWNSSCNDSVIQYFNYLGTTCSGSSILTRTYKTHNCYNCNNAQCKD
jgi:hypothetical protein